LTFLGEGAEPAAGKQVSTTRRLVVVVLTISPRECTSFLGGAIVAEDRLVEASLEGPFSFTGRVYCTWMFSELQGLLRLLLVVEEIE
jgi:hypothetical protein